MGTKIQNGLFKVMVLLLWINHVFVNDIDIARCRHHQDVGLCKQQLTTILFKPCIPAPGFI